MTGYIPPAINAMVQRLQQATGHTPTVTQPCSTVRHLELSNDRVTLTIDYRRNSRGKWCWIDSKLYIDGRERPKAQGFDDFVRIWGDPDGTNTPQAEPVTLPEVTPLPDDTELPAAIEHLRSIIRGSQADDDRNYIGQTDDGYTLVLQGTKGTAHLYFTRTGKGEFSYGLDPQTPFRFVDHDGIERTDECNGQLEVLLEMFLGASRVVPGPTPSIGRPRQAAAVNSVTVRRSTVIRV